MLAYFYVLQICNGGSMYQIIFESFEDFAQRSKPYNPIYTGYTIQGPIGILLYSQQQEDYTAFLAYNCGEPKSHSSDRTNEPTYIRYQSVRMVVDEWFLDRGLKLRPGIVVPPADLHRHAQRVQLPLTTAPELSGSGLVYSKL